MLEHIAERIEGRPTYECFVIDKPGERYTQAPALRLELHPLLQWFYYSLDISPTDLVQ